MSEDLDPSGGTRTFDDEVLRRTFRLGALAGALAAAAFGVFYGIFGPQGFVWPHLAAAAALGAAGVWRIRDPKPLLYGVVTIAMLLFGWQLVLLASVENAITLWFVVPCVAAMLSGQRRLAQYSLALSVFEVVGVVVAARHGLLVPAVALPSGDLVMAVSTISVLALCGGFAGLAHRTRKSLLIELDARHAELTHALADAREARNAALEAARSKDRFFANLTHEIRTPLGGIAGAAELLQHADLGPAQRPLADALSTSTRHLAELVNAMLEHARLAAGHVVVERQAIELQALVRHIEGLHRAAALGKGLAFEVRLDPGAPRRVNTDELKLRQIVGNLVSNAIKFTERGSIVVALGLTGAVAADGAARLCVRVTDTGPGIAPGDLDSIFQPFVQGDSSMSRAHGGTGLGLAIARGLAERLGGTLGVSSHPGAGSTFTVELPVAAVADAPGDEAPAVPQPPPSAAPARMRVLLVEDNEVNRLVVGTMLEKLVSDVRTAEGGEQALRCLEAAPADLIFMDMQMPRLDGLATTREIRRREAQQGLGRVPVIALTGNTAEDYGQAASEAGMDGYLTKPVTLAQLQAVIAAACPGAAAAAAGKGGGSPG